jgi:hypothetical protein
MDNNNRRPERRTKSVLKALRRRARKRAFREASATSVEPVPHGRTVDIPFAIEPLNECVPIVEPVYPSRRTVDIPFAREPSDGLLPFVEPVPHDRTVDIPFAIEPLNGCVPIVEPVEQEQGCCLHLDLLHVDRPHCHPHRLNRLEHHSC